VTPDRNELTPRERGLMIGRAWAESQEADPITALQLSTEGTIPDDVRTRERVLDALVDYIENPRPSGRASYTASANTSSSKACTEAAAELELVGAASAATPRPEGEQCSPSAATRPVHGHQKGAGGHSARPLLHLAVHAVWEVSEGVQRGDRGVHHRAVGPLWSPTEPLQRGQSS
jgi:hypothetical protein